MSIKSITSDEAVGKATMAFGEPYASDEEISAAEMALRDLVADHEQLNGISPDLGHAIVWRILVAAATARKQPATAMTLEQIKKGLD
jgi:hypothetical protein